jgi:alkanesulfonate monooxygenase SsuD/methylene tetrahydromethanopterin reductase-like flavin-dependent oxidoreductase (luciferase family)
MHFSLSVATVLGAADPVRDFQDFATLNLISHGRAEIVAGRGSTQAEGAGREEYNEFRAHGLDHTKTNLLTHLAVTSQI